MRDLDAIQGEAVDAISRRYSAGAESTYIDWATGAGKTVVAAKLARRWLDRHGGRILFLAERKELLRQCREKFADWAEEEVAIEQGTNDALEAAIHGDVRVVAASVATLHEERLATWPRDAFNLVIVDECHHCVPGSRYINVLAHFHHRFRLGLSATPDLRMDGVTMRRVFGLRAHRYAISEAIEDGHLLPIKVRKCATEVDIRGLRVQCGEFTMGELESRILPIVATLSNAVAQEMGNLSIDRAVGFTPTRQAAFALADGLSACGIPAVATYGEDPERDGKLKMLDHREVRVIFNAAVLNEGWDAPYIGALINCSPTKSAVLMRQRVGRILRLYEGQTTAWVIEPTWLDQRYEFASVTDVLADEYESEHVLRAARHKIELEPHRDHDPAAALAEARAELAEREEPDDEPREYLGRLKLDGVKRQALRYQTRDFDPVGVTPTEEALRRRAERGSRERVRKVQREQLKALGIGDVEVRRLYLNRASADDLIREWTDRRARGLADWRTVNALRNTAGPDGSPLVSYDGALEISQADADDMLRRPLLKVV